MHVWLGQSWTLCMLAYFLDGNCCCHLLKLSGVSRNITQTFVSREENVGEHRPVTSWEFDAQTATAPVVTLHGDISTPDSWPFQCDESRRVSTHTRNQIEVHAKQVYFIFLLSGVKGPVSVYRPLRTQAPYQACNGVGCV